MDLDGLNHFMQTVPARQEGTDYDAALRSWLAAGEIEVGAGDGPPCTLIVMMIDADGGVSAFAVPNTMLDAQAHEDLAAVTGAGFQYYFFNADLAPEQFAGAFRLCGGASEEPDLFEEQIEELRAEMDDEAPDMDWDALAKTAGAWNEHRLESGAKLPGPITHCYTARLSM